jgi:hypothetical protein
MDGRINLAAGKGERQARLLVFLRMSRSTEHQPWNDCKTATHS